MKKWMLDHPIRSVILGIVFLVFLFASYILLMVLMTAPVTTTKSFSLEKFAQLGDSFGVLTSFFSAVAALIAAILLIQNMREVRGFRRQANLSYMVERGKLQPKLKLHVKSYKAPEDNVEAMTDGKLGLVNHSIFELGKTALTLTLEGTQGVSNLRIIYDLVPYQLSRLGTGRSTLFHNSNRDFYAFELNLVKASKHATQSGIGYEIFVVYQDATTLPSMQRFFLNRLEKDSSNWIATYVETVLIDDRNVVLSLETFDGCVAVRDQIFQEEAR